MNVPEEKIILKLDNQKTYRIFENLFVNIQKYAMPNSRVYIDVEKPEGECDHHHAQHVRRGAERERG